MSQREEISHCPNCGSEKVETSPVMGVIRHFDIVCAECSLATRVVGIHRIENLDLYDYLETDYMEESGRGS